MDYFLFAWYFAIGNMVFALNPPTTSPPSASHTAGSSCKSSAASSASEDRKKFSQKNWQCVEDGVGFEEDIDGDGIVEGIDSPMDWANFNHYKRLRTQEEDNNLEAQRAARDGSLYGDVRNWADLIQNYIIQVRVYVNRIYL